MPYITAKVCTTRVAEESEFVPTRGGMELGSSEQMTSLVDSIMESVRKGREPVAAWGIWPPVLGWGLGVVVMVLVGAGRGVVEMVMVGAGDAAGAWMVWVAVGCVVGRRK